MRGGHSTVAHHLKLSGHQGEFTPLPWHPRLWYRKPLTYASARSTILWLQDTHELHAHARTHTETDTRTHTHHAYTHTQRERETLHIHTHTHSALTHTHTRTLTTCVHTPHTHAHARARIHKRCLDRFLRRCTTRTQCCMVQRVQIHQATRQSLLSIPGRKECGLFFLLFL